MTERDVVDCVNALHNWLKTQDLNVNEALAVLAETAGAILGTAADHEEMPIRTFEEYIELVKEVFETQARVSAKGNI
jgi:hypothetical protein